jgi:hypothetical protein
MVEDAAQDTLLTLHARRHTYEPGRPFKHGLPASRATNGSTGYVRSTVTLLYPVPRICPRTYPSTITALRS